MLDLRGTGRSATPEDAASCRCDRLVNDVEALRERLGLKTMDLLAHSGGANLAARYVERHPQRVGKLALITPSVMAVGLTITGELRLETARLRRDEPWFAAAFTALEAIIAGEVTDDHWRAITPFSYGRWDETTQAHKAAEDGQRNKEAFAAFGAPDTFAPDATRAALARFDAPVLVLAGEVDLAAPPQAMAELTALFPNARLVVQPGARHVPWLDDADRFVSTTTAFLE